MSPRQKSILLSLAEPLINENITLSLYFSTQPSLRSHHPHCSHYTKRLAVSRVYHSLLPSILFKPESFLDLESSSLLPPPFHRLHSSFEHKLRKLLLRKALPDPYDTSKLEFLSLLCTPIATYSHLSHKGHHSVLQFFIYLNIFLMRL